MIGQPATAFEPIVAKLQTDVGQFLALKQRLLTARMLPLAPAQRATVDALYADQTTLEAQLPGAMQAVQRLQAGQLSFGDSITVTTFVTQMELHNRRVTDALAGLPAAPSTSVDWSKVVLYGSLALGAYYVLRGGAGFITYAGLGVGAYLLWRQWSTP